jgi:hypothetical protein
MTMNPRWMAIALLAATGAWGSTVLAEDLIVIETSNDKVLAEGTVIADGKPLKLPAGVKVTLVGGSGKALELAGPYDGVPSAGTDKSDNRVVVALASLVTRRGEDSARVGAFRDIPWRTGFVNNAGDVMSAVDVDQRGPQCVLDPNPKQLALVLDPAKKTANSFGLVSAESGMAESLAWPTSGAYPKLAWPATLPIEDGNTYLVDMPQRSSVVQFTLRVLSKPAQNNVERMAQLVEAGCNVQAKLMLEVLKKAAK